MITVTISINGKPIMARSATNTGETLTPFLHHPDVVVSKYVVDDGSILYHDPRDGAVPLALQMLQTIKEFKKEAERV